MLKKPSRTRTSISGLYKKNFFYSEYICIVLSIDNILHGHHLHTMLPGIYCEVCLRFYVDV